MAILSCWRRWAPGAAGRFVRRCCSFISFGQRAGVDPAAAPVIPAVAGQQRLAFGPKLALAGGGIFTGSRWFSVCRTDWPGRMPPAAAATYIFAAAGRGGVGRIVRPDVLDASLHLFLHLAATPCQKALRSRVICGGRWAGDSSSSCGTPPSAIQASGLAEHLLLRTMPLPGSPHCAASGRAAGRHGMLRRQLAIQLLAADGSQSCTPDADPAPSAPAE